MAPLFESAGKLNSMARQARAKRAIFAMGVFSPFAKLSYHVRSITLHQVGAPSPTISANNLQSQKPARPGYYGQSIGHDIKPGKKASPPFKKQTRSVEYKTSG
jgi:hypothetical protein